jgi:hypothetical protein
MTVSQLEQEHERLTGKPEYERLSDAEKTVILHRLLKHAPLRHPHRADAIQAEIKQILKELRTTKGET